MSQRQDRVRELFKNLAAEFLSLESNRSSLVTVTNATVSSDLRNATIFITVYPEEKEKPALDFAKRKQGDFREFVSDKTKMRRLPRFVFEIDEGEKRRQQFDSLLDTQ